MRILAVETATRTGSWALVDDSGVVNAAEGDGTVPHDVRLPQALVELLAAHGLSMRDVDLFAVATGPGSFTGLRVGIASVQGLAMAMGKHVVPIPTLDAIALDVVSDPGAAGLDYVAAWLDGQRGEIFAALYAVRRQPGEDAAGAMPGLLMPPQVGPPSVLGAEIADLIGDSRAGFAGDGAHRYRDVIDTLGVREARVFPIRPIAPALARLAWQRRDAAVLPHAVVPVYVRRPDAELARDRAASAVPGGRPAEPSAQ